MQLRTLRETHGLSVRALAERVGVSKVTIWKWERGDNEPRNRHLLPLAKALQVRPEELKATLPPGLGDLPMHDQSVGVGSDIDPNIDSTVKTQARDLAEVVSRAKQMIADASGVAPKNISITIEY